MNLETSAIVYGLASAASWGTSDFNGGLASKHNPVFKVVLISQIVSLLFMTLLAFIFAETIPIRQDLFFGILAGVSGTFGLIALYRGLSQSNMGIIAPMSAVLTAIIPIVWGTFEEGLPAFAQMAGFGLALLSVWALSSGNNHFKVNIKILFLPLLAGLNFGLYFIFIDQLSGDTIFGPLIAARFVSIPIVALLIFFTHRSTKAIGVKSWLAIALAGIFDTGGNAFFVMATRIGRLDISAVLASLYPAATVMLAWFILKEKLSTKQWMGVVGALIALGLIAS